MSNTIEETLEKAEHSILMRFDKENMDVDDYLYLIGFVAGSIGEKKFGKIMNELLDKQAVVMSEELWGDLP